MPAVPGEFFVLLELKSSNSSRLWIYPYPKNTEALSLFHQRDHSVFVLAESGCNDAMCIAGT